MGDMAKGIKSFREGMKDEISDNPPQVSKLDTLTDPDNQDVDRNKDTADKN